MAQHKAIAAYRRRLKQQGMARVEVHVRKEDVGLVRDVVRALCSPEQQSEARALLRQQFLRAKGLKALLAEAPLEGVNLKRERDLGRDMEL